MYTLFFKLQSQNKRPWYRVLHWKYSSHTFTSLLLLLGTVILYCGTIQPCLVRGRLSFDENLRAKEGGKEKAGETRFVSHFSASRVRRVPLPFVISFSRISRLSRSPLCENEALEKEAAHCLCKKIVMLLPANKLCSHSWTQNWL